jgi:hypothetical protein
MDWLLNRLLVGVALNIVSLLGLLLLGEGSLSPTILKVVSMDLPAER